MHQKNNSEQDSVSQQSPVTFPQEKCSATWSHQNKKKNSNKRFVWHLSKDIFKWLSHQQCSNALFVLCSVIL